MSAQYKQIIPDPQALLAAGVCNVVDAVVLVHIGRCGTNGTMRMQMMREIPGISYSSLKLATDRLENLKLITVASKLPLSGTPFVYMVTGKGWKLLTHPGDYTMFPQTVKPLGVQ